MQSFYDVVVDTGGNPIAGAQVFVYDSLGVLATLYSDVNNTPQANPIITNADGGYLFYAANGIYSVVIVAAGYNSQTLTGITISGAPSTGSVDIQEFSTPGSYTWTKPAGARFVEVLMYGGGGGGGSGRRRGALVAASITGGSGGAAGSRMELRLPASALSSTETVVVGAGGVGGAPQTVDNTNGITGSFGGDSTFATLVARGGGTGLGGIVYAGTPVSPGLSFNSIEALVQSGTGYTAAGGASTSGTSFAGSAGGLRGGGGAGGAGLVSGGGSSNNAFSGGLGGTALTTGSSTTGGGGAGGTAGGNGSNGADSTSGNWAGGSGGGGGSSSTLANAGSGGNGGFPGGGGGGGGASEAFDSGAGGNGGNGFVRVVTYL
jgi:hypothetical protein